MTEPVGDKPLDCGRNVAEVVELARLKGVRMWAEKGQLHYKAPQGALTCSEIERLRALKGEIIALLQGPVDPTRALAGSISRLRLDRAPLSYSQLTHWHAYRLGERRSIRQVASAMRMQGRLNTVLLERAISETIRRQDALRTRIVVHDGVVAQEISERYDFALEVEELTTLSQNSHQGEIDRSIRQLVLEPTDVAADPLFAFRLLRLRCDEHLLIVAMEHIISDGFSVNILWRDIFTAYGQALKGWDFALPEISVQLADYAVWQRSMQDSELEGTRHYWRARFAGYRRLRFPTDATARADTRAGWGTVSFTIGRKLKEELREWCRTRHTTLVMSMFAVYVALVLRWCNEREGVFQYQSDGRNGQKIQDTIGYFATVLYLRISLLEQDNFVDLLERITQEYCMASEHGDFSYLAAEVPRPEFTRNPAFNWLPQGSLRIDPPESGGRDGALRCSLAQFAHPLASDFDAEVDSEPSIVLLESDMGDITAEIWFPRARFSTATMERFGRNFLMFVERLAEASEKCFSVTELSP